MREIGIGFIKNEEAEKEGRKEGRINHDDHL